jgi:AcrR family transcriptional regulator
LRRAWPAARRRAPSSQRDDVRVRILEAAVEIVASDGLAGASVSRVIARARLSRRTFDRYFASVEDCVIAVIEDALADVAGLASAALQRDAPRQERLRYAIADVLAYFDERPALARVCLVGTLTGSPRLLTSRLRVIERFRSVVAEGIDGPSQPAAALTAEASMASILGLTYAELVKDEEPHLVDLVGPIMSSVVRPLPSERQIAEELRCGAELARGIRSRRTGQVTEDRTARPQGGVPSVLVDPRAFRARKCLHYVAANPGASNRLIGDGIGVAHRGQLSALLASLRRLGLVVTAPALPGHANAWRVTPHGRRVALAVDAETDETLGPAGPR